MGAKFVGGHVEIDPPKRTKKLTGTRFASVLGLNRWSTPFQIWCQVTKTYEPPFEDTIYTTAGKVIEPKICDYLRRRYFMDIKTPEDVYGADYFKKTYGDFFKEDPIFGGMWDFLGDGFVVEVKTTKRAEDWAEDIPPYYKLQAALYAYLLHVDRVIVPVSFLSDADYAAPEKFEPSVKNTKIFEFSLCEEYPNFESAYIEPALMWWEKYVETGISPAFDEKTDAEYLKGLRTTRVELTEDIDELIDRAEKLTAQIELADAKTADKRAELKKLESEIKRRLAERFAEGDKKVELQGGAYLWSVTKSVKRGIDPDAVKTYCEFEGIDLDEFMKETETLTLRKKAVAE